MALQKIEDLIAGHRYSEDKDGGKLVRVFKFLGLTRGTGTLLQARQALGLSYGSAHPNEPGMFVTNIDVEPVANSREQARAFVTYKTPDSQFSGIIPPEGIIRWRGGQRMAEVERYSDGTLMYVNYNDGTTTYEPQIGRVSQPERFGVLSYEKEMTTDPEPFFYLQGSINNAQFRGRQKWSWMCTDFDAEYYIRRQVFRVAINLEWAQYGHWTPVMWTDKVTGLVPKSVVEAYNAQVGNGIPQQQTGNGWVIKLYGPEADFNQFGLPAPGTHFHAGGNF